MHIGKKAVILFYSVFFQFHRSGIIRSIRHVHGDCLLLTLSFKTSHDEHLRWKFELEPEGSGFG